MFPTRHEPRRTRRPLTSVLSLSLAAAFAVALAACVDSPAEPMDGAPEAALHMSHDAHAAHAVAAAGLPGQSGVSPADQAELGAIRAATAHYQRFEVAEADGFVPLSPCVAIPGGPGMGYHYGRVDRIQDPAIIATEPEILLYEPMSNGRLRLVGVEYMVHGGAWYAAGNTEPPSVAGRTFDPPNPMHPEEHLRPFYTLHVWVWRDNPGGMFAPFNPNVSCG